MFKKTIFFTIIIYLFNSNILIALEPDIFVQSTVNRASLFYLKILKMKRD